MYHSHVTFELCQILKHIWMYYDICVMNEYVRLCERNVTGTVQAKKIKTHTNIQTASSDSILDAVEKLKPPMGDRTLEAVVLHKPPVVDY